MTPHDLKQALARAWQAGWESRKRHEADGTTEWHKQRALGIFLAREEAEADPRVDDETRRFILGALQAER